MGGNRRFRRGCKTYISISYDGISSREPWYSSTYYMEKGTLRVHYLPNSLSAAERQSAIEKCKYDDYRMEETFFETWKKKYTYYTKPVPTRDDYGGLTIIILYVDG